MKKLTSLTEHLQSLLESKSNDGDGKIENKAELKGYAYKILKNAHGEDFDSDKADEMIDDLIKKYKDDWKTMSGIIQNSVD